VSASSAERYISDGWICLRGAIDFSPGSSMKRLRDATLDQFDIDPQDWSSSPSGLMSLPPTLMFDMHKRAPIVAQTIQELLSPLEEGSSRWSNALVINHNTEIGRSRTGEDWHVDGDHFVHYADGLEQLFLVIVLWTDVAEDQGPTHVDVDSPSLVAEYLLEHPEGVAQADVPAFECCQFRNVVKATGSAGDVYVFDPLSVHWTSANATGRGRVISNPVVSLREAPPPAQLERSPVWKRMVARAPGLQSFSRSANPDVTAGEPARLAIWSKGEIAR